MFPGTVNPQTSQQRFPCCPTPNPTSNHLQYYTSLWHRTSETKLALLCRHITDFPSLLQAVVPHSTQAASNEAGIELVLKFESTVSYNRLDISLRVPSWNNHTFRFQVLNLIYPGPRPQCKSRDKLANGKYSKDTFSSALK